MPDIKEKQPIKSITKERTKTTPKAPIRRGVKPVVAKTKQQLIEASRGAEPEDQRSQQAGLEMPTVPRHTTQKIRNPEQMFKKKHSTETPDKQASLKVQTEPVNLPQQGTQLFVESQGRNAARKKMVQKHAARNKTTPTDPESRGVSSAPKEIKITEIRHTDGKSVCRTPAKQIKTRTNPTEKRPTDLKSVGGARKAKTKTGKAPKEKASVKSIKHAATKPTQASIAVQKATEQGKKSATKTMKKSAKQAAKSAAKAMVASMKSLGAVLGTGGAVVVAVILVLMLVGGLLVSPMGIFFSGNADNSLTIQQVMGQCNAQLSQQITDIENSVSHDELEQTGQTALWKDVLAVYAVKVTTDPEHPLEVVTMDEERAELLREIFFTMNTVDYFTEIYTEEITVEVTDEGGNVTEETQNVERT